VKIGTHDGLKITGKIKIDTYRAGMVDAVMPYLRRIQRYDQLITQGASREVYQSRLRYLRGVVDEIKAKFFTGTAVECPNLIMDSPNYGLDLIIQRLVGINTYSLNISGRLTPSCRRTSPTAVSPTPPMRKSEAS
jgi:hypothetical protein